MLKLTFESFFSFWYSKIQIFEKLPIIYKMNYVSQTIVYIKQYRKIQQVLASHPYRLGGNISKIHPQEQFFKSINHTLNILASFYE